MSPLNPTVTALSSLALSLVALLSASVVGFRARADRASAGRRLDALAHRLSGLESRRVSPLTPNPTPRTTSRVDPPQPPAPTLISVPNLSTPSASSVSVEASAVLGRRFSTIWELADAGTSAEAIARATGHPVGQVELILGLRRQISTTAPSTGGPRPS